MGLGEDKDFGLMAYIQFLVKYRLDRKPALYPYKMDLEQMSLLYGKLGRVLREWKRAKKKLNR